MKKRFRPIEVVCFLLCVSSLGANEFFPLQTPKQMQTTEQRFRKCKDIYQQILLTGPTKEGYLERDHLVQPPPATRPLADLLADSGRDIAAFDMSAKRLEKSAKIERGKHPDYSEEKIAERAFLRNLTYVSTENLFKVIQEGKEALGISWSQVTNRLRTAELDEQISFDPAVLRYEKLLQDIALLRELDPREAEDVADRIQSRIPRN